jgi:hypothetical protein
MAETPFIDLHPDKISGSGPETALLACRRFLDEALRRGWKEVRIITGIGIHGDGTPRLRSRVEKDVLSSFSSYIDSQHYEQGGAVIHLFLLPPAPLPDKRYQRKHSKELEHKRFIAKEERLLVALERFEAAEVYFDEGDFRRARLKLNQIMKELFPGLAQVEATQTSIGQALRSLKKQIDALG